MSAGGFSGRALAIAGGLGALSLVAAFAAVVFGGDVKEVRSAGADAFSGSAIGHRAFAELLRRSGHEVELDRRGRADEPRAQALVLALEPLRPLELAWPPDEDDEDAEDELDRLEALLAHSDRVLVALPKRVGIEDFRRPGRLMAQTPVDEQLVEALLERLGTSGELLRPEGELEPWSSEPIGFAPTLDSPQLVRADALEPVIASGEGVLLGRLPSREGAHHYVLTDPDLLATHGLGDGENAALALAIVRHIAGPDARVVFDEVLHGHGLEPSIWTELGRFPLVLVLMHALVAMAFLVWAAMKRFGAPRPAPAGLAGGKRLLIENTAGLLTGGGYASSLLRRYLEQNERRVAERYHVPADLEPEARRARLAALRPRGQAKSRYEEARAAVGAARRRGPGAEHDVLEAARLVRQWREEMLHGDR